MRYERKAYEKVTSLPEGTLSIKNYAIKEGIKVASVYGRFDMKKIKIVEFEGTNYVIPEK
jgi:hypothetical protein